MLLFKLECPVSLDSDLDSTIFEIFINVVLTKQLKTKVCKEPNECMVTVFGASDRSTWI